MDFLNAHRQRLTKLRNEIIALGSQALGSPDSSVRAGLDGSSAINQTIAVKSAEAKFENAKLAREIAEIGVVEYEEGTSKQEEATLQGEVRLAESDAARAADFIGIAKGQLAQIKKASHGSAEDLCLEFACEDKIAQAIQREPKAKLAAERARAKLDNLRNFAKPRRVKELKDEVEKARLDELVKKAVWKLEESKIKQMEKSAAVGGREPHSERVFTLLQEIMPLGEDAKAKLERAEKNGNPSQSLRKELSATLDQLETLLEQSRSEHAAARWAAWKPKLQAAAARYLSAPK